MEAVEGFEAQATYTKSLAPDALPPFIISESSLGMGASLGNSALWIHTKGTGAIERIFLNETSQSMIGTLSLRYGAHARPVSGQIAEANHPCATYSGLFSDPGSRVFEIHRRISACAFNLRA
jgi:hypothetical protein